MKTLEESLDDAWRDTKKLYSYPPIEKPYFSSDTQTAAIDMNNHKIRVNKNFVLKIKKNAENKGETLTSENIMRGVLQHEVNHYMFCPYDLSTTIKIENEIRKVTTENVHSLANYFMDAVINLDIAKRKKRLEILDIYKHIDKTHPVDQLMCALYQDKTKTDLGVKITDSSLRQRLEKLKKIDYLNKKKWLKSSKKFAEIIYDLITDDNKKDLNSIDDWNPDSYSDSEIEKTLNDLSKEMQPKEFTDSINAVGIDTRNILQGIDVLYYEQQSRKYLMNIKSRPVKSKSVDYNEHRKWEVSDSVGNVDVFNSYGRFMPGISQVWKATEQSIDGTTNSTPDLLLAIDSSGSMPNPLEELSNAVLGSFCAARVYLENNSNIATYNFSDSIYLTDFCKDKDKILKNLALFQAGGTMFDVAELKKLANTSKTKADIIIVTDMQIYNFNETMTYLKSIERANRISILWINPHELIDISKIQSDTFSIYRINNNQDITKIMIGEACRY